MKKLLLLLAAPIVFFVSAKAQCLTHVKYTSSKMEMLDSGMNVQDARDVTTTFETTEKGFTATQDGDDNVFHGTLKSPKCDWKEPFKNGT
jgi:hypothetical protein